MFRLGIFCHVDFHSFFGLSVLIFFVIVFIVLREAERKNMKLCGYRENYKLELLESVGGGERTEKNIFYEKINTT